MRARGQNGLPDPGPDKNRQRVTIQPSPMNTSCSPVGWSRGLRQALRAVVWLAARRPVGPAPAHVIAGHLGVRPGVVIHQLGPLVSRGILGSIQGPAGGYWLARGPSAITLLEVVEAVGGPIQGEVPLPVGHFPGELSSSLTEVCQAIAHQTRRLLEEVTIAALSENGDQRTEFACTAVQ